VTHDAAGGVWSEELAAADALVGEERARSEKGASHLLCVEDLGREGIEQLLRLAAAFEEVNQRPIPRVPALRGRTVVTFFAEPSTRTRLSFEAAARRLSADVLGIAGAGTSSLAKGESLRDTFETFAALGADLLVVRHARAGVPAFAARVLGPLGISVVNAGDGAHEHPTQALADLHALWRARAAGAQRPDGSPDLAALHGLRVAIVGDVRHSRVARSLVAGLALVGARVVLVAPRSLLPPAVGSWPVETTEDLDGVLGELDVCYLLRLQLERGCGAFVPSVAEYARRFGLDAGRARALKPDALVMHPGPMNRGVEIAHDVVGSERCLVANQVASGLAVRMAVIFSLLCGPDALPG
jgi:aspartate carbamoyltransferase catalytic subunit